MLLVVQSAFGLIINLVAGQEQISNIRITVITDSGSKETFYPKDIEAARKIKDASLYEPNLSVLILSYHSDRQLVVRLYKPTESQDRFEEPIQSSSGSSGSTQDFVTVEPPNGEFPQVFSVKTHNIR